MFNKSFHKRWENFKRIIFQKIVEYLEPRFCLKIAKIG